MVRPELDRMPAAEVVDHLLVAEQRVLPAVRAAAPAIALAAELVAGRWRQGGRIVLAGAGTSGRIAWSQAAELPGTFGVERARVVALVAGGVGATDDDEDDLAAAAADLATLALRADDALVAVAASGSTPYTLALARAAVTAGSAVVAVTAVAGSPLAGLADVAIEAVVGPEALRGSSRLGAGTAQKIALDAMTTTAFALLGRVHGDLMIDVVAANAKLRARSAGIVAEICGCSDADAERVLAACGGDARAAVLVLARGLGPDEAITLAASHDTLREALTS
ncbi:MAG: N-acetylmuramic acid 6-phosphate etherase [Jatrophihabitans sp.]|uniref:N-acetylmuramic acid 6-phosphate etherase n=1 Tax=Jatrophihabitans sp. TaxID=1932789 RepID=UPI003F80C504